MKRTIDFETPLTQREVKNFLDEGWFMVGHAFLPGIGTGKDTRDTAAKKHTYTFEKGN
jgi:hypothetical protein